MANINGTVMYIRNEVLTKLKKLKGDSDRPYSAIINDLIEESKKRGGLDDV